ncbi:MAG: radical SAM protein [bacterium]|nr:radical SAM protein [bacterium]
MITGRLRPVFKLTESCNLACKYCYQEGKLGSGRFMDKATLEKALTEVAVNTSGTMHLLWFGGEPTLYGIKRFAEAMELARSIFSGRTIYHGMQTNGTLINDEWAALLAENNFAVTVSLDGPEWIHNDQRPFKASKSGEKRNSYEAVTAGIQALRKHGIEPRISAVLTQQAMPHAKELVTWYAEHGVKEMDFVPSTRYHEGGFEVEVGGEDFKTFIMEVFDTWLELGRTDFKVRLLSELARKMCGKEPHYCKLEGSCSHFVGFAWNGDVYPCDEFSGMREFCLGNIHETSLPELMGSPKAIEFFRTWAEIPADCQKCKWLRLCRGGCPWERQLSGNPHNPTIMCPALKALFERLSQEIPGVEERWTV